MKLNAEQQKKVEDNLGLVNKVINDKVHGPYYLGMYTRDDLFQIGCIGLCKAAATDKGVGDGLEENVKHRPKPGSPLEKQRAGKSDRV